MSEMSLWFRFVLAVLATWRVTHLLAYEDGPADLILRLRRRAGKLMDCFHCVSFWVAAPVAFFTGRGPWELAVTWLALSGAACLLDRICQAPLVITRGEDHGMLRTETDGMEQPFAKYR